MEGGEKRGAGGGPRLLAVETATRVMGVAVLIGERVVAEVATRDERAHSERLLPGIDRVLREAGVELAEIDGFAVSIGPGSFTGLRIALATVKGFALAAERPVAPVPTLAALALAAPRAARGAEPPVPDPAAARGPASVVALLDARRGEVYAAGFERAGALAAPTLAEGVYTPDELARELAEGSVLVAGEGAEGAAAAVAEALAGAVPVVSAEARAARVGRLGARILAEGRGVAAADLVPRYVRRAEAEVRRTGERLEPPVAGSFDTPPSLS